MFGSVLILQLRQAVIFRFIDFAEVSFV